MKQQSKPLGKTGADDADVRGEHTYPDRKPQKGPLVEEDVAAERSHHYAAGADGTQMVSEPEGAAPTGEAPTEEEQ